MEASVELEAMPTHQIMRETAARFGIRTANLHKHLNSGERINSGFLWWDQVHLTSWGQSLLVDYILPNIHGMIASRRLEEL